MRSAIKSRTQNFGFALINFNFVTWHDTEHTNWRMVDALLASMGAVSVRGAWANNTAYEEGVRVVDPATSQIYVAQVDHVSAPTGTFEEERTANPSLWTIVTSLPVYRGLWQSGIGYSSGDIVFVPPNGYYFCVSAHTSSATFAEDASRWTLTFDAQPTVDLMNNLLSDAEDARDAAEGFRDTAGTYANNANSSAIAANTHRANAVTAQNNAIAARDLAEDHKDAAAGSASAASTSASNAAGSASTATTQAGNAATSATNASNSATAANTAKTGAETARNKAQEWATKAENSPVETGQYSAFHWAAKAAASASLAATFDPANFYTKTESDGRFANLTGASFTGDIWINTSAPTINFKDTDQVGAFIHVNNNKFYVLRASAVNSSTWGNGPNNRHPLMLDLADGHMTVSGGAGFGKSIFVGASGQLHQDGNVHGSLWGGYLSNWLNSQLSARADWGSVDDRVHRVGHGDWSENGVGMGWHDMGDKYIKGIHVNAVAPWISASRSFRIFQHVPGLGGWQWAYNA